MSIHTLAEAWDHSSASGTALLVLLVLADDADRDSTWSCASLEDLSRRSRLDRRTVQRKLRELEEAGEITTVRPGGRTKGGGYRPTVYAVHPGGRGGARRGSDDEGKVVHGRQGRQDAAPGSIKGRQSAAPAARRTTLVDEEPSSGNVVVDRGLSPTTSVEGRTEPRAGTPARTRVAAVPSEVKLRISGKPVDPDTWARAVEALEFFNEQAGRAYGPVTGAGEPSESAKRVYLRLREHPDLDAEAVRAVITNTLASQWWGDGPAGIGVVFGPKVFEDNLTRKPKAPSAAEERRARRLAAAARLKERAA